MPLPAIGEDENPFELPSGWAFSRLESIVDITSGVTLGRRLVGRKLVTIPYLRVANVQRGFFDLGLIKEIDIAEDEIEKYRVLKRDLLITEGGDWDKVGRTAIWAGDLSQIVHQNHIFKARRLLEDQNEAWIEKYLNSALARRYFESSSKQTTNLASINKTQLRRCVIPIPSLAEQARIVSKVNELMILCDKLKSRLNQIQITEINLTDAIIEQIAP
jgi:type I restriction enzyme, S subunit